MANPRLPAKPESPREPPPAELNIPPHVLDPDGRLAIDAACTACGYNLRTLLPAARCPECNTPVAETLGSARIVFYDPQWIDDFFAALKPIKIGMALIVAPAIIGLVVLPIGAVTALRQVAEALVVFSPLISLLGLMVLLVGTRRLGALPIEPAPHADFAPHARAIRRGFWGALTALLALLILAGTFALGRGQALALGFPIPAAIFVGVLSTSAFVARDLTRARLARRISGQRNSLAFLVAATTGVLVYRYATGYTALFFDRITALAVGLLFLAILNGLRYLIKLESAIRKDTGRT